MKQYTDINDMSVWDNYNFRIITKVAGMENLRQHFWDGIRFQNGVVKEVGDYVAKLTLDGKNFEIRNEIASYTYKQGNNFEFIINDNKYYICNPICGLLSSLGRSSRFAYYNLHISNGIPSHSLAVCFNKEPVFRANVCLYDFWALLLSSNYVVKALVLYDKVNESSIYVSKVIWSSDGTIYKLAMLRKGLML